MLHYYRLAPKLGFLYHTHHRLGHLFLVSCGFFVNTYALCSYLRHLPRKKIAVQPWLSRIWVSTYVNSVTYNSAKAEEGRIIANWKISCYFWRDKCLFIEIIQALDVQMAFFHFRCGFELIIAKKCKKQYSLLQLHFYLCNCNRNSLRKSLIQKASNET